VQKLHETATCTGFVLVSVAGTKIAGEMGMGARAAGSSLEGIASGCQQITLFTVPWYATNGAQDAVLMLL